MNNQQPISDNLNDLYMEIIMDHYKCPRNRKDLSHLSEEDVHENPSCGDSIKLEVVMGDDGKIDNVHHDGHGCAISTASASMMTELLTGRTPEDAREFIKTFIKVMRGEVPQEKLEEWGDLAVLGGVVQFPLRVKCAVLAWHALDKVLDKP